MVVTVAVLVGTSFVPGHAVEVWMVTAPAGILAFLFNLFRDTLDQKTQSHTLGRYQTDPAAELHPISRHDSTTSSHVNRLSLSKEALSSPEADTPPIDSTAAKNKAAKPPAQAPLPTKHDLTPANTPSPAHPLTLTSLLTNISHRFPSTTLTLHRLPLPLLPFAMCEFILVRGLSQRGWIRVFATGFARATPSPVASVFFFAFVCAAFLCPLAGTNIGATIILVEILRHPAFLGSAAVQGDPRVLAGGVYAVAMGSNLGAFSYTFAGSLAGLLWRGLLREKGVEVGAGKFAVVNALPLVMQTGVAALVVWGEVYWFENPIRV